MREFTDSEIQALLEQIDVPPHREDLADKIIAKAMSAEGAHHASSPVAAQVKQGDGFVAWWSGFYHQHSRKIAMAACVLVAVAIMIPAPENEPEMVVASTGGVEEFQYTVNGVPMLADIALIEEPDWEVALLY